MTANTYTLETAIRRLTAEVIALREVIAAGSIGPKAVDLDAEPDPIDAIVQAHFDQEGAR